MKFTNIISPFLAWGRAAKKADTVAFPSADRPGAPRYRGFHINDLEKCIGCGRCEEICQNAALDMTPTPLTQFKEGDTGLRPRVDYGRCCWCALCVDVCSTGSLGMTNEYLWSSVDADEFIYTPGLEAKPWDDSSRGYRQAQDILGWAGGARREMPVLPPDERIKTFDEVVMGFIEEDAVAEAARCIQCGLCVSACPAHMHIPEYLLAIAERRFRDAVEIFYQNNPLPEMCGKVCTRRCEMVCALGHQGEPIAIRWLKRFATERFDSLAEVMRMWERKAPTGKQVAVIGAGPAGLTAAYYLALAGHDVEVFDADRKGGGVTRSGIPMYRLPDQSLDKQMEVFKNAGVTLRFGQTIDQSRFVSLCSDFDAVFIAVGLTGALRLRIEGEDLGGVESALDLLARVNLEDDASPVGERVVVIGGGNVAMDASRVARRLGAQVVLSYRRRVQDMPADDEEIEEAKEEGIEFRTQTIPLRIESRGSKLLYLYGNAEMIPDQKGGRPRPRLMEGTEHELEVDRVFVAVGQAPDLGFLPKEISDQLKVDWGKIVVDADQFTGVPGIFAGGDITPGRDDAISAIADGLRAVRGIRRLLEG